MKVLDCTSSSYSFFTCEKKLSQKEKTPTGNSTFSKTLRTKSVRVGQSQSRPPVEDPTTSLGRLDAVYNGGREKIISSHYPQSEKRDFYL
jgi:hypothetical protein